MIRMCVRICGPLMLLMPFLPAAAGESAIPPFSRYEIIQQRNFFRPATTNTTSPHKTPGAQTTEPSLVKLPTDAALTLTGIVNIRGTWKAILENKAEGRSSYVAVGDQIEDYEVKEITENKIVLLKDGISKELGLAVSSQQQNTKTVPKTVKTPNTNTTKSKTGDPETITGGELIRMIRTGRNKNHEKK